MRAELIERLRCPQTGQSLSIQEAEYRNGRIRSGWLVSEDGSSRYPIVDFIPRFVPPENYAGNFGFQWKKFRQTQLDSHSGLSISGDRFYRQSGWKPEELQGKWILDVGCGAGRFAEVAVASGAHVVAIDYSVAVEACFLNHGDRQNIDVLQADVYRLPFEPESFDYVYCFGVLQHTPDVERTFMALASQVKPGGRLAVDVYRKHWSNWVQPKYWLRPFTRDIPAERLFPMIEKWVPRILPISDFFARLPFVGKYLCRFFPVVNYRNMFPFSENQLVEWSILDTFDWYGPAYDQPQTVKTLEEWFRRAGFPSAEIIHPAHLTGRGSKPARPGRLP